MPEIVPLTEIESWARIWEEQAGADAPLRMVFKRSPRCPISRAMEKVFERFAARLPDDTPAEVFRVDVVSERDVSRRIADDTRVKHESPQALFIGPDRAVLWHASHYSITESALEEALRAAGVTPDADPA
ncbi:MAG: bacillithiol system redox-active protein YtxJ [Planctomycetota bacterium]|jgi:bacillithiol system protein YtxJ